MASNLRLILDEIQLVRESIQNGSYDHMMCHPAYERLNVLVLKVCTLVPESLGDAIDVVPAELVNFEPNPSLNDVLEAARQHCSSVTFRFSDD